MNAKNIVTLVLLVFVGASGVYLLIGETKQSEPNQPPVVPAPTVQPAAAAQPGATAQPVPPETTAEAEPAAPDDAARKVIAYYFHSTQRCRTCLTIERFAEEALIEQFGDALADGSLEWHALNTDEPANAHFVKDYELVASSLVLVEARGGAEQSWMNLDRIWELVRDEPAFKRYVAEQARVYLEP
jgi:hypothetical protein